MNIAENYRIKLEGLFNHLPATKAEFAATAREFLKHIYVPMTHGEVEVKNPSTGILIYSLLETDDEEFARQREMAEKAAKIWATVPLAARREYIIELSKLQKQHKAEFALSLVIDMGKPYLQALAEVEKGLAWYDWVITDEVMAELHGEPLANGSSVIESANYSRALADPDLAIAPMAGNVVWIKPPADAPAWVFLEKKLRGDALAAWGQVHGEELKILQQGLFNITIGHNVRPYLFTDSHRTVGSRNTGRVILEERRKAGNYGVVINELNGINPHIATADADIAKYVGDGYEGVKSNTGQRCTCPDPWLVDKKIFADVKKLAAEKFAVGTECGNPFAENKLNGALIKKSYFDDYVKYLAQTKAAGAEIIGGGRLQTDKFPDAYYVKEALVVWENPSDEQIALILEKEIFAPVANLVKISGLDNALEIISKAESRLSGGFYGNDADYKYVLARADMGSLHHNRAPKDDSPVGIHAQKGGLGVGVTGGVESVRQYMKPEIDWSTNKRSFTPYRMTTRERIS